VAGSCKYGDETAGFSAADLVSQSGRQPANQPASQVAGRPVGRSVGRSVNQSVSFLVSWLVPINKHWRRRSAHYT
jgi:hypothetical protein